MAPPPGEIKLEDIDFEQVAACTNYRTIKAYIKLLNEDGAYFVDLLNACKKKLLELNPKEYYILYPRVASQDEVDEAARDILEWEASVKETDASLRQSKQHKILDEQPAAVSAPIRGQEPVVARANVQRGPEQPRGGPAGVPNDKYARDKTAMRDYYAAWDKVNVDELEEELDAEEAQAEEARRRHFDDLREQQEEAHRTSPVEVGNLPAGVPEAHRQHLADSEKEKGNEAFYAKDWEEAEAYYSRSIHFRASDPSTWANRALVRLKLDKAAAALEDCDRALELNARYVKALHRRGKALHELRRYEEAVQSFQLALAESPGNTQINGDLMVSRRHLRDPAPAPAQRRPAGAASTCRIEELDDDDDDPAPRVPSSAPAAGYTRVAIEEDSDSEEEAAAPANSSSSTGARGFTKVAIEEVSGSESEGDAVGSSPPGGRPRAEDSTSNFQASDGFAGARPGFVFKLGDMGLGYYRDAASPGAHSAREAGRSSAAAASAAPPASAEPAPRTSPAARAAPSAPSPSFQPPPRSAAATEASSAVCFDDMD